jgi:hypothetical protein
VALGNRACSRLSAGWTRSKAGPQPGLAAPRFFMGFRGRNAHPNRGEKPPA